MQTWKPVEELRNETGIVFGTWGEPLLEVALDLASGGGERPVGVIAAANPAGLKPYQDKIAGVIRVTSSEELAAAVSALKQDNGGIEAVVFYGLSEYAQQVLAGIADGGTVSQPEWAKLADQVSKDLRSLMAVMPIVYVTCDILEDDDGKLRFNVNRGLMKFIVGDLYHKRYVVTRSGPEGEETVIQDNNALAIQFKPPRRGAPPQAPIGAIRRRRP